MHPYAVRLFSKEKDAFCGAEKILNYPWGGDYRPETEFSLSYGENALYLALRAWEKTEFLRMTARGLCRDVWHDSCLECFLMPKPEIDARYLNFEFNPAGAMYLGLGTARQDNEFLEREDISQFEIWPFREDAGSGVTFWGVKAQIPLVFLRRFFPLFKLEPGINMRANFYKCGEKTPTPHYACWSKVNTQEPDFHRPEYFGLLTTL